MYKNINEKIIFNFLEDFKIYGNNRDKILA